MHYNMHPKGSEKQPCMIDIEFLHIMISGMQLDVTQYMWEMIQEFRTVMSKCNMPFGQMITQLCLKAKVKLVASDKMVPSDIGPIIAGVRRQESISITGCDILHNHPRAQIQGP